MMLCRLLEDLDCTLVQGRSDIEVNAICCDSRSVTPGCVFVCLPGQHIDGRRFAHAAAAAGAAVLVFEDTLPNFEFSRSCNPALVQAEPGKARRVLALMAARLYGYPARRMTMIGITGTKGKTTTAHLLAAVLTAAGRRVGCIGTNGAVWPGQRHTLGYTTPESCDLQHILRDMADDGCDACVMEVSSLGLKMDRVGGIEFDVGVFTNLSPDHIGPGEHASYAEYRAWKSVAAVIGCMDAAFGIGIIHKAIFAAALCNLIDLELIQIVSRLRVFRCNIAADSEVVLCILLNMTAIVPDISMGYVNVLYRSEPFRSVRICLNHALTVTHLK